MRVPSRWFVLLAFVVSCSSTSGDEGADDAGGDADVGQSDAAVLPDAPDAASEDVGADIADAGAFDAGSDASAADADAASGDVDATEDSAEADATDATPDADADDVAAAVCGDGVCGADEACETCPLDCGECGGTCGDGACDGTEDCESCVADCGACTPNEAPGFVAVPAGAFVMGSPPDEVGRWEQEVAHVVTLTRGLQVASTETTQEAWTSLMGNNPSYVDACGANCPVEFVNWFEALAYANELSRAYGFPTCYLLEGCDTTPGNGMVCESVTVQSESGSPQDCAGYRLPTEAEWEYVARANTGGAWPCGDDGSCVRRIGWYEDNSGERTHQVNSLQPNAFGLYDTHGNVWEWVWDGYVSDLGTADVIDPITPINTVERGIRGGSWINTLRATRSATRIGLEPSTRNGHLGFRLVRTADAAP